MKKVITYGTYDVLHYGHIRLLERAKALGDYLIVGVTSDQYDISRGKSNVSQSLVKRIENVRKLGIADEIIVEEYEGQKIADIKKYKIDIFAIGSDWEGKFDYIKKYCDVVYLERTQGVSSTMIRDSQHTTIHLGIIGYKNPCSRVIKELSYVSGIEAVGIFVPGCIESQIDGISTYTLEELLSISDAIYINTDIETRFEYIMKCVENNIHILCESPAFLSPEQANNVRRLTTEKRLVFLEAVKTAFFPAFEHLKLLVDSGKIGTVKSIDVSFTQMPKNLNTILNTNYRGGIYDQIAYVLYPIFQILGTEYSSSSLYCHNSETNFNLFTKGILIYEKSIASFTLGIGIKTESEMIITGTHGYVFVPSPWWKTDYFEIRYEDIRENRRYFYPYPGEGFRCELNAFVSMIQGGIFEHASHSWREVVGTSHFIEDYEKQNYIRI